MQIDQAQSDVRLVYAGGFFGQLVSGVLWLTAAAVGTFSAHTAAIAALAAILSLGGVGLALWGPGWFSLGAWITGVVLVTFAFLLRAHVRNEVARR